jgi:hypothetical protein
VLEALNQASGYISLAAKSGSLCSADLLLAKALEKEIGLIRRELRDWTVR